MSNILPFTLYNLHSPAEALRLLAAKIDAGEVPAVRVVVAIELVDGGCDYKAFGQEPFTRATAVGLLEFAKANIIGAETTA